MIALQLGREARVAYAEIEALAKEFDYIINTLENGVVYIEPKHNFPGVQALVSRSGGIVRGFTLLNETTEEDLVDLMVQKYPKDKITFGVSVINSDRSAEGFAGAVKKLLKEKEISARFVVPKNDEDQLNTGSLTHNNLDCEIVVTNFKGNKRFGMTTGFQDSENWGFFDYQKPVRDARRGMLPPKLARTMINLLGFPVADKKILDPFCGLGTVSIEALRLNAHVIAADADPNATKGTKENLAWAQKVLTSDREITILQCDARDIGKRLKTKVDAIVCETFLGIPNNLTVAQRKEEAANLQKLYLECLKGWKKILEKNARIVMAVPQFHVRDEIVSVTIENDLARLGYTLDKPLENKVLLSQNGNLLYRREKQTVGREILLLTYHG